MNVRFRTTALLGAIVCLVVSCSDRPGTDGNVYNQAELVRLRNMPQNFSNEPGNCSDFRLTFTEDMVKFASAEDVEEHPVERREVWRNFDADVLDAHSIVYFFNTDAFYYAARVSRYLADDAPWPETRRYMEYQSEEPLIPERLSELMQQIPRHQFLMAACPV